MRGLGYECLAGLTGLLEIVLIFAASLLLSRVVDGIADGSVAGGTGLALIGAYAASVYLSTVFNILSQRWIGRARIQSFASAWVRHVPRFVPRALRENYESFFVVTTEQIPRARELRLGMVVLLTQMLTTYVLIFARSLSAGRYELLLFALPFAGLNFIANLIWAKPLQESLKCNIAERSEFLSWHRRYFAACASVVRHWRLAENEDYQRAMIGRRLGLMRGGLERTLRLRLQRLSAKSVLCDLPFYLGICYFLHLGASGKIGLGSIFFWLTMNELLFRANGGARDLMDRHTEWRGLQKAIAPELARVRGDLLGEGAASAGGGCVRVTLLSGEDVTLTRNPGLRTIAAANGSGKSHLLRLIAGEESKWSGREDEIRALFAGARVALVTPEFETLGLAGDAEEVFGPRAGVLAREPEAWPRFCRLPEPLAARWWTLLQAILRKYPCGLARASSGEKALLSLARALTFMDQLDVLLLDEVDGPLAEERRGLVRETVLALAKTRPVYLVSHHEGGSELTQHGVVLGYSVKTDQGMAVPFSLHASADGRKCRSAVGGVAIQLMPLVDLALENLLAVDSTYVGLARLSLTLKCDLENVRVTGIDSAGLAMALALINLKRRMGGEDPFSGLSATGQLDLRGRVFSVSGLERKREAAARLSPPLAVIGPDDVEWVGELEACAGRRSGRRV